jgi:hypothetical protein
MLFISLIYRSHQKKNQHNNVITVIINKERKKIVILPLGLNRKLLPNVRTRSVEDYCLVQIPEKLKTKHGENSKRIIEELVRDEKITEQEIQTNIEKSIIVILFPTTSDHYGSLSDI